MAVARSPNITMENKMYMIAYIVYFDILFNFLILIQDIPTLFAVAVFVQVLIFHIGDDCETSMTNPDRSVGLSHHSPFLCRCVDLIVLRNHFILPCQVCYHMHLYNIFLSQIRLCRQGSQIPFRPVTDIGVLGLQGLYFLY